ncbi:MAG: hypothetical protein E6G60_12700 [Actinobacteria bacterium]|nr:MAG: hypothetical protein E6G60_12700 [Actinomycetota bacterium]
MKEARARLQDLGYVAVGVSLLSYQRAQMRRVALQRRVSRNARAAGDRFEQRARELQRNIETAARGVTSRVEPVLGDARERVAPAISSMRSQMRQVIDLGSAPARTFFRRND